MPMVPELDELVPLGIDDTPKIAEQAEKQGWRAGIFSFGTAEQERVDYLNPGLVERPDGLWLMVRRSVFQDRRTFGMNSIWACKLNEDKTPHGGSVLTWLDSGHMEQFEDARVIYHAGQTWVAACNFIWHGSSWTGAHQVLGIFDQNWQALARRDPKFGGNQYTLGDNTRHEKNWIWFFHDSKLHLLYNAHPWMICEFGLSWEERNIYPHDGVTWNYGEIRGGTPPVLVDGIYWTFFHSSMPWFGRYRRYYMGALGFEGQPPFRPLHITPEPLLAGSQKDRWGQQKPIVVFPCGSILKQGEWFITLGVNDLNCGWLELPHVDLLKLAVPIGTKDFIDVMPVGGVGIHGIKCTCPEQNLPCPFHMYDNKSPDGAAELKQKRQAQAAKARAALAEKRKKLETA